VGWDAAGASEPENPNSIMPNSVIIGLGWGSAVVHLGVGCGVVSGLQTAEGIGFGEFGPCTKLHHIGDHISGHRPPV
jgi:hypothetical protein